MLGHIGINVPDLAVAQEYYDDILPMLDYELCLSSDSEFGYMPAAGKRGSYLFFYCATDPAVYSRERIGLQHLAFIVPTRSAVRSVHRRILELRGEVAFQPQEFPQYPPPYFATFWTDPFGLMLEAVCHHDRD
jgi:catechol 2,3-dioxygenase-like lactoylglutathione lyase family enzyme